MLKDVLDNLPHFLMFFIPGYIFLLKRRAIHSYKKDDEIDLIIKSVGVSAIIKLVSSIIISFIDISLLKNNQILNKNSEEVIIIFYIFMSYILFYLYTYLEYKFNNTYKLKLIKTFEGKENFLHYLFQNIIYRENKSSVWNHVLENSHNKQIRVYIKESNIVYMGFVKHYTLDPEEQIKEICLNKFSIVEEIENWEEGKDIFKEKNCFFYDDNSFVYLTSDNIQRIELINCNNEPEN